MPDYINYTSGYKYQLFRPYSVDIPIKPKDDVDSRWLYLTSLGRLSIRSGYAWDGPSGPTVDSKNFMRGSLVHDAIYQLTREGHIPKSERITADKLLRKMCLEDGMSSIRAWWVYKGVRLGGSSSTDPKNKKRVHQAPRKPMIKKQTWKMGF